MYKNFNLIVYSNKVLEQTNYLREMVDQKGGLLATKNNNVYTYWHEDNRTLGEYTITTETVCVL